MFVKKIEQQKLETWLWFGTIGVPNRVTVFVHCGATPQSMAALLMAAYFCTLPPAIDCPVPSVSQLFVSSQWGSCVSHTGNLDNTGRGTAAALTFDLHVISSVSLSASARSC